MKKWISILLVIVMSIGLFAGCSTGTSDPETDKDPVEAVATTFRIGSLKGPTTMGMVKLMSDMEAGELFHDYQVSMYGTADEIVPKLVSGEMDVALVPCNLASVLYNKTKGAVQVAAVNTLGVLYIVESGDTVQSIEDLRGKTIYSTGKGNHS
jgi:NitT/TauT family transport system substrate-binding protein